MNFKTLKTDQGFVLLYTVLIAAIVLAIAIGITTISYQEIVLSTSAREGNTAFFAADTGAECALYADLNLHAFDTPSTPSTIPPFYCVDNDTPVFINDLISNQFKFDLDLANNTNCAKVTVYKNQNDPSDPPFYVAGTVTRIESLGYNVPCRSFLPSATATPSPRQVERAIRATYGAQVQ